MKNKNSLIIFAILIATIYFTLQVITIGSRDIPVTYWAPKEEGCIIEISIAKEFIKDFFAYFGYGDGKIDVQFLKDNSIILQQSVQAAFYQGKIVPVNNIVDKIIIVTHGNNIEIKEIAARKDYKNFLNLSKAVINILKGSKYIGNPNNIVDEQSKMRTILNYRYSSYFDEIYHARTAYELLKGLPPYDLVHPPLGKWLISIGMAIWGVNPFGWRFVNLIFGSIVLVLILILLTKLYKPSFWCGIAITILLASDFLHNSLSRTANIDTFSLFFVILCSILGMSYINNMRHMREKLERTDIVYFLTFSAGGLAFACKWNALYPIIPVLTISFGYKLYNIIKNNNKSWILKTVKQGVLSILAFTIPYYLAYLPITIKYPYHNLPWAIISDFIMLQKHIWKYHSTLVATHPFSSEWYQWLLSTKPLWAYFDNSLPTNLRSTIAYLGNPVMWGLGLLAMVYLLVIAAKNPKNNLSLFIVIASYVSSIVPWIFISRIKFIYHYYLALPWLYIAVVMVIDNLNLKQSLKKKVAITLSVLGLIMLVIFYPAVSGLTVSAKYIELLRIMKSWIF
ncbi:glycosyltransferase family 39 protein [Caldicellulosiruptor sp. DIB 104C]|uniref:glycosyltransferase family 39 protein n=1 Tax=Caldicellulosiruptor sp. DIB 104C TaxID=3019889 RepID=UPI002305E3A1|nr:glycosyltransferase family 39 protein [Caldicellulosiruptor sp. DIB 104C]